mgnify:CR=1 FL=1
MLLEYFIYSVLTLSLLIQGYFHLRFFLPFGLQKPEVEEYYPGPVSIVISARNEEDNLRENLPLILEQDYPEFEVVVVNHASYDDSEAVLEELQSKYPHLKTTRVDGNAHFSPGKKYALTIGIKASKHPYLLMSDADTQPTGKKWLKEMASGFKGKKDLVLGYSPMNAVGTYAGLLGRLDAFFTGLHYLSFAFAGRAYMGVGRNLAYSRELFFRNRGFASHLHLPSGDDDLFVNETAKKGNYSVVVSEDAQMRSFPKKSFLSWFRQKRRHFGTSELYKGKDKRSLGLLALGRYLFYFSVFLTLLFSFWNLYSLVLIAIQVVMIYVVYLVVASKIKEKAPVWLWPLLEWQILVFHLMVYLSNKLRKPKTW